MFYTFWCQTCSIILDLCLYSCCYSNALSFIHSLPTKKKKFKRRKHRIQKWVTKGIIKSIDTKDKMYKKLVQSRFHNEFFEVLKAQFNTYRNILKKVNSKVKRMYYVDVFTQFKNKPGKLLKKNRIKINFLKYLKDFVIFVKS